MLGAETEPGRQAGSPPRGAESSAETGRSARRGGPLQACCGGAPQVFLLLTVLGRDAGLQVDLQADLVSLKGCRGERADHGLVPPLLRLVLLHGAKPREVGLETPCYR